MSKQNYDAALDSLETTDNINVNFNEQPLSTKTKPTSLGNINVSTDNTTNVLPGYLEIYSDNFPSGGLFYKEDTRFFIRPADVREIRQFSTINEQDPFSVDEALTNIIKSCFMMRQPGKMVSFKDLKEEDRIHIILSIRDLTFVNGENQLKLSPKCKECDHENSLIIKSDSFDRTILKDNILKYFNEETRNFDVQTKSSGVISIAPPSIGIMQEVTKWIQKSNNEGKKIDQAFVKVLPYMITDWRGLNDSVIKNLEMEFMSWNTTKYQTMYTLVDMCRIGVKEELTMSCEKCGAEVTTPISFPGGIKSLFVISNIDSELL